MNLWVFVKCEPKSSQLKEPKTWSTSVCVHWIYLLHEFHNLSWITEINELFHDILIYWDAPVYVYIYIYIYIHTHTLYCRVEELDWSAESQVLIPAEHLWGVFKCRPWAKNSSPNTNDLYIWDTVIHFKTFAKEVEIQIYASIYVATVWKCIFLF